MTAFVYYFVYHWSVKMDGTCEFSKKNSVTIFQVFFVFLCLICLFFFEYLIKLGFICENNTYLATINEIIQLNF